MTSPTKRVVFELPVAEYERYAAFGVTVRRDVKNLFLFATELYMAKTEAERKRQGARKAGRQAQGDDAGGGTSERVPVQSPGGIVEQTPGAAETSQSTKGYTP